MIDILKLLAGKPRILYIAATDGRYAGAMAVGDGITGLHVRQEYLDINEPIEKGNRKVAKFNPNIVIGYPSAIKLMAEQVQAGKVPNHVRRAVSCGEPLSVEGICVDGLKDYQFVQTSDKTFQIMAEISKDASKETITHTIESIIEPLLSDKALENISYEICFVESIAADPNTGKKPLIVKMMDDRKAVL